MRSRPGRTGHPSHGFDALLAAIATMAAAWPISTLLAEPTWLRGMVLLLVVVALTGVGARSFLLRGWQVLMVQLVCFVLAASTIYDGKHLWHGLPTFETLGVANLLIKEALTTAQAHAAPAPTTPGLIFVVGCGLGLVALSVDYLAVTRRSPSLAGLPLLTAFLVSAANSGSSLPVNFFLAAAAMWLILVARAGGANLRRWGTTVTTARIPSPPSLDFGGVGEYASLARMLGVVALVAAVAVPVILPRPAPKFLASGLGRSPSADSDSSADTVGFSLSLALSKDLKNRSNAPVLQFRTADTSPPPLRVTVSSFYRSEHGMWLPWGRPLPALSPKPALPEPAGLSPEVPRSVFGMAFHGNLLGDPFLAAPYPLVDANLAGVSWGADTETQAVRVAQRPDAYTASYWRLEPTATMLHSTTTLSDRDRDLFELDLALDGPYVGRVTALAEQVTSGKIAAYDKAMAIQQYLRVTGGFTYSLTLAPPAKDRSGNAAGFDPLTNFLVTKQGYCVQFATAMAMMSRAVGVPSRIAIGFLPGTEANGVWSVTASDAHAWPELYLRGLGWTRFEPTPSRGAPPAYAIPATSPGTSVDGDPLDEATTPAPRTTASRELSDPSADQSTSQEVGLSPSSVLRRLTHGWGPVLLGSLIVLLGSMVVPTAALRRRRRNVVAARTATCRIEVQWELLTSSLSDLGIPPAPSHTPRQQRAYYDREAFLDGAASQALGRVVQTLERSRYAVIPPASANLAKDARAVYRAAAGTRRRRDRLRAALWPSDGIAQLSSARAELAWRVRAPLRGLKSGVRQRFHRRHRAE